MQTIDLVTVSPETRKIIKKQVILLRKKQSEIAETVGISPQAVKRISSAYKKEGTTCLIGNKVAIIKIERGNVMIRKATKEDVVCIAEMESMMWDSHLEELIEEFRAVLDNAECEKWTRQMGCSEFASDCELNNDASLAFHRNMGFTEAGCIICFTKQI